MTPTIAVLVAWVFGFVGGLSAFLVFRVKAKNCIACALNCEKCHWYRYGKIVKTQRDEYYTALRGIALDARPELAKGRARGALGLKAED